jgi:sugar O-acyltransferase (sialic acid O-acetyltransferase NeuD family)
VNKSVKEVIVLGAGGHAKVVISTLLELNFQINGVLDDDPNKWNQKVLNIPVLGPIELLKSGNFEQGIIAIGDNKTRKEIVEKYNGFCRWISIIHPFSYVHPSVEIGDGSVIFAGAVIQPEVIIGKHVIINTSASVDHDCKIEDFVHIAPGVHLAGGVSVGEGSLLGVGSSIIPYKRIGGWTIVGAGSVVINDIPDCVTVVGVPARPIGDK